ncbi:hypothetical protein MRX96_013826 [Rhipicephalus microplus]
MSSRLRFLIFRKDGEFDMDAIKVPFPGSLRRCPYDVRGTPLAVEAELSEMYQASLNETGFQNYFSPPPVGQNFYMPNYYFYPQAYPQPPPVYTLPPLPPAPIYAPASPEELEAFPPQCSSQQH